MTAYQVSAPRLFAFVRGLLVLLLLSIASVFVIAQFVPDFFAAQRVTLHWGYLLGGVFLLPWVWLLDGWRYQFLAKGLGLGFNLWLGTKLGFLFRTASMLTPGSAGGQPVLLWYLVRKGHAVDRAAALAIVKPLLGMLVVSTAAAIGFLLHPSPPAGLRYVLWPGFAFFCALALLLGFLFVNPRCAARLIDWLLLLFARVPFVRATIAMDSVRRSVEKTVHTISELKTCGFAFGAANLLLAALWYATGLLVVLLLVRAVGLSKPILQTALDVTLLRALAIYAPTPGAAGIAEGGITWLFGASFALTIMALYRLFFSYCDVAIGLWLLGKELWQGKALRS